MNELPDPIKRYLISHWMGNGKFAYLNFDSQGLIKRWHPNINHYGLTDLNSGDQVLEKLIFLEGLLPFEEKEPIILFSINFTNEIAADIHMLSLENDFYALFFDVSHHVKQLQALQQERHNLDLLYQQQHKNILLFKRAYIELDAKKKQAESANKEKNELLTHIVHDLRTPLGGIMGLAQLLSDNHYGELNEKQRENIKIIFNVSNHMNDLINGLLAKANFESGTIELHPESIIANRVADECIRWLQPVAEQQTIKLINRISNEIKLIADAKCFKQIMINLLGNAIKYNRENGCVIISSKLIDDCVRIRIKDTGIGIADNQLEKIFQPFTRVLDKDLAKKIQGEGIGLNECKKLVALMQGSLSVRSELNVGSTFFIDLPLTNSTKNQASSDTECRLVYCYQESIHYDLLSHLFIDYKHYQLFGCDNVEQAVQISLQNSATHLLIDIDGERLSSNIQQLQALQNQLKSLAVIAVFNQEASAFAIREAFDQLDIEDYLIRPFDFNQLADIFA